MTAILDSSEALEKYLAVAPGEKPGVLGELLVELRSLMAEGHWTRAASILRRAVAPGTDFTTFQSLFRVYAKLKPHLEARPKTKLAILGSFTTSQLAQAVELALFSMGGAVDILEAEYGVYRQEILDEGSELYRFEPNIVFLAVGWRDLSRRPDLGLGRAEVSALVDAELADWSNLWRAVHERLGCLVVQNTFDRPAWRQMDNHEMRHPASLWRYVSRVNDAMADGAPPYVVLHDVDGLSSLAGRRSWGDERFFFHAKMPCAPEFIVDYGFSAASLLAAQLGLSKKCLVLDLDNTCWGGVVGDDGLGGIRLGQGGAEGEAFVAFQQYAKALKQRGVLLAVCSKNEESIAKEVFEKHTEMVLRLDDISCFMANWTDKAANLREIARRLNIGLDSLVFVDDNPAERALVRQLAPEVAVPELPEDPAGYIQAVETYRHFQPLSIAPEDLRRSEYYRADAAREQVLGGSASVEDYLRSLKMTARIGPVTPLSLERAAQLINKSNQFNLTTKRRSAAEVSALASDPRWLTRTVSLADRFGDNGLIGVLLAKVEGDVLLIDTWLMSCRVLKRGVETLLNNHLCRWAAGRGLRRISGEYVPTAKNNLVRDHFAGLGYVRISADGPGPTRWEMPLTADWSPRPVFIEEVAFDG
ncbi:MAG: HAD-IIIC family phosphatase [Elusimicrobiota bacterium]